MDPHADLERLRFVGDAIVDCHGPKIHISWGRFRVPLSRKRQLRRRLHPAMWRWCVNPTAFPGEDVFPPRRYYYIQASHALNHARGSPLDLRQQRYYRKLRRSPWSTVRCIEVGEGGSLLYTTNILARGQFYTFSCARHRVIWERRDPFHPRLFGVRLHDEPPLL